MNRAIRFPNQPTKGKEDRNSLVNPSHFNPDLIKEVRVDHIEYVTSEIQKDWHRYWVAYVSGSAPASDLEEFKKVFEKHCMVEQKLEQERRRANHETKTKSPS